MHSNRVIKREESFDNKSLRLYETLFSNANGYIGVRGCLEEGTPSGMTSMRGMYLGGVYETIPMKQAESLCNLIEEKQTMLNVADTQTIRLFIEGEELSLSEGEMISGSRILDMDRGFTERQLTWKSPSGKTVEIGVKRMAHFATPELFTMEYKVKAIDFEGDILLESLHISDVRNYSDPSDPRLAAESPKYLHTQKEYTEDDMSVAVSSTEVSRISIASAVCHRTVGDNKWEVVHSSKKGSSLCSLRTNLRQGQEASIIKYTSFSDTLRSNNPETTVKNVIKTAMAQEISDLYKAQSDYLQGFWEHSGMEIEGNDELNMAMCFNMYQLICSAPRVRKSSIAAKGLTGEGYEGHYFWDTEMYALPFFVLTDTDLARHIVSYRYETLDKARENAALLGHKKGALYPWRTITGEECSGYFPSGSAAYHINGAVAFAVIRYYQGTGDVDFLLNCGLEMLIETSRLWLDTGNYDRDGNFVINEVTGPDEYTCMTDNNFYTNCAAKYTLKFAAKYYEEFKDRAEISALSDRISLKSDEIEEMKKAAEKMMLPYDERLNINPQDDSFLQKPVWDVAATPKEEFPLLLHYHPLHLYRYQVCKQADTILAHFLFPEESAKDTMESSFRYYEKITTHDSSLSTCVFSMQASRLGLHKEAEEYFGDSALLDLENRHGNSADGVHTANMGGAYMAIVYGFAGVRISEIGLSIDPFVPGNMTGYSFRFNYQGNLLRLNVSGSEVSMELLEGEKVTFKYKDDEHIIERNGKWISTL